MRCKPHGTGGLIRRAIIRRVERNGPSLIAALRYGNDDNREAVISSMQENCFLTSLHTMLHVFGYLRRKYPVYESAVDVVSAEAALSLATKVYNNTIESVH
jgi:hypothetical protein